MAKNFGHEDALSASGEDLSSSVEGILRNKAIDDFLRDDNRLYLIGPKGTGKSLLLLAKAFAKLRDSSVVVVPRGTDLPIDKLSSDENLGVRFWHKTRSPEESSLAWSSLWTNAILKAALYNLCDMHGRPRVSPAVSVEGYGEDDRTDTRIDSAILRDMKQSLGPPPYYKRKAVFSFYAEGAHWLDNVGVAGLTKVREENDKLRSLLHVVGMPLYIFIDNLDRYYELKPDLWLSSMYGQFRAIREIRIDVRNIHVVTTVRRDIYNRFETEQLLQYRDFITFLSYSKREILDIFAQGIGRLDRSLLADATHAEDSPWRAFFGDAASIPNQIVSGHTEDVRDYIFRHTLWRPREVVTIGNELVEAKGYAEMTPDTVRQAVNVAAAEIRRQYLREIAPTTPTGLDVQHFLSEYVPGNVLKRSMAERVCRQYNEDHGVTCIGNCRECADGIHPFCHLYSVGLLGYVTRTETSGAREQVFLRPGEFHFVDVQHEKVPNSGYYVLHPILYDLLGNDRVNSRQVVGYGLPFNLGERAR